MISNPRFCFCKPEKKNFYQWSKLELRVPWCIKWIFLLYKNSKRNAQVKSIAIISSIIIKNCIECYFWPKGNHKFSILLHKMRILILSENSREEYHFQEYWYMAIKNFLLMDFRLNFEAAHQHQWIHVDALNLPYNNPLPPTKRCLTETQHRSNIIYTQNALTMN